MSSVIQNTAINKLTQNQEIVQFIKNFFGRNYKDIESEVDIILNNVSNTPCAVPYPNLFPYSIVGLGTLTNNSNHLITLSILTPNLFRKCFVQNKLLIPNICPTFSYRGRTSKYIPLLLDPDLIKSFLYYGFSSNIYDYTPPSIDLNQNFVEHRLSILNLGKDKEYDFKTRSDFVFVQIYKLNSLLIQVLELNALLIKGVHAFTNNLVIRNFDVPWNSVKTCICNDGIVKDTYVIPLKVTLSRAELLSINNFITFDKTTHYDTQDPFLNVFYSNSIFNVINAAVTVTRDTLQQIQYLYDNKQYNLKSYMLPSNIPKLLELYKNYYNNQINIDTNYSNSDYNKAFS
jgi:hypothetical protein